MASTHPITGVTSLTLGGQQRTLAFDMNCAAALHDSKGPQWNDWLVRRFLGEMVEGTDGERRVTELTPEDTITALYALMASDREDHPREETEKSLRRSISPPALPDIQLALVKAVLAGFGVPGEFIEAVANAVDAPRNQAAAGTGTVSSALPTALSALPPIVSGDSPLPTGARSPRGTRRG